MSEFHIEIVQVGKIEKHPNADSLSVTSVFDYPVIIKTGDFLEGDLAVYIPVDSICPETPVFSFLKHSRIKAAKLRGIFSMGLLIKPPEGAKLGDDVRELLGITKWEPEEVDNLPPGQKRIRGGNSEKDPGILPCYTDIEGYRKYYRMLEPVLANQEVILTEKIHGANARYVHDGERLWCASHKFFKRQCDTCTWWEVANQYDLENRLAKLPLIGIYGEIYGQVQKGYKYDVPGKYKLRIFDAYNTDTKKYLDYDSFIEVARILELETAPVLYRGLWNPTPELIEQLSNGKSTMNPDTIKEGFVLRPAKEVWDHKVGRVVLKYPGSDYLLDRGKRK